MCTSSPQTAKQSSGLSRIFSLQRPTVTIDNNLEIESIIEEHDHELISAWQHHFGG